MGYGALPLEKRLKENIRNYRLANLYKIEELISQMRLLHELTGIKILLTDRHGEKMAAMGNFADFTPDVVGEPGRKLRVANRTVGHVYTREDAVEAGKEQMAVSFLEQLVQMWERLGEEVFINRESAVYIDEIELMVEEAHRIRHGETEDMLTGVLNKSCFKERMKAMDDSEVVPVAAVEANINDWKFANDHFGDEESDRLIQIIARILKEEAGEEYVLGRVDGDVFHIAIPLPEEGEAEGYMERVQSRCNAYTDTKLTPSVAVGLMYKTNVEETLDDVFAEAEYKMFENKFEMKQNQAYQARLRRGLK
ncbi:MAG: diguanylate cyclase [Lachnospiraceae bacterium]|jgi:diguanylate cyclase (GGDEF)-like protein|nr:diguanylate cyclase [Lachnospiraceae bacterium]